MADGSQYAFDLKLDVEAFNTRAAKALRGACDVEANPFLLAVLPACEAGERLSPPAQNGLYRTVLRFANQIHDQAVVEFATLNARGYV